MVVFIIFGEMETQMIRGSVWGGDGDPNDLGFHYLERDQEIMIWVHYLEGNNDLRVHY